MSVKKNRNTHLFNFYDLIHLLNLQHKRKIILGGESERTPHCHTQDLKQNGEALNTVQNESVITHM